MLSRYFKLLNEDIQLHHLRQCPIIYGCRMYLWSSHEKWYEAIFWRYFSDTTNTFQATDLKRRPFLNMKKPHQVNQVVLQGRD
jgi:hypothetical protein